MLSKSIWAITLTTVGAGIAVSLLPGLGNLGYFSALVSACLYSISMPYLGVEIAHLPYNRQGLSLSRLTGLSFGIPALLVLFNLVWLIVFPAGSPTCDWTLGIFFYALGPGVSAHVFLISGLLAGRKTTRLKAHLSMLTLQLFFIGWEAFHFYSEPAVFSYSPLFGYFAGPIYDAAVTIDIPYLLTRTVQVLTIWLLVYLGIPGTQIRIKRLASLGTMVLIAVVVYSPPGWNLSGKQRVIDAALPNVLETGNVVLKTRFKNEREKKRAKAILADADARYQELREFFEIEPSNPLEIYFYPSPKEQRKLMGAGKVRIAKPWLSQVHLSNIVERAPVLKHEMVHVFGAEIASGFLGIPTSWGILPKMALIEGIATYLEGRRGERSLHQWCAALLEIDRLPEISAMMGTEGYTSTYGPTAYTAAGSFLGYLDARYGREKFLSLYEKGDFPETFGVSVHALESEWKAFLQKNVTITKTLVDEARFVYDRKAVLNRKCPVVVARLERQAAHFSRKQQWENVLNLREEICAINPSDPHAQLRKAISAGHAGRLKMAVSSLEQLLNDEHGGPLKARILHALADFTWLSDRPEQAVKLYEELLQLPLGVLTHRSISVKQHACSSENALLTKTIRDYLLNGQIPGKERRSRLIKGLEQLKDEPMILYLAGKLRLHRRENEKARDLLKRALSFEQAPFIRAETLRTYGISLVRTGSPGEAIAPFKEAVSLIPAERKGLIQGIHDWKNWAIRLAGKD